MWILSYITLCMCLHPLILVHYKRALQFHFQQAAFDLHAGNAVLGDNLDGEVDVDVVVQCLVHLQLVVQCLVPPQLFVQCLVHPQLFVHWDYLYLATAQVVVVECCGYLKWKRNNFQLYI